MSVICIVRKNGEACLAADTMARFGSTKETAKYIRNGGKIVRYGDSVLGVVGHAVQGPLLSQFLKTREVDLHSKDTIIQAMLEFHRFLKEECFLNPAEADYSFETSCIHILIANPAGIFGAYECRSVQEYTRFYSFGSGEEFALGAMFASYESDKSAEAIARCGVLAACEFDDGCAEPIEFETVSLRD